MGDSSRESEKSFSNASPDEEEAIGAVGGDEVLSETEVEGIAVETRAEIEGEIQGPHFVKQDRLHFNNLSHALFKDQVASVTPARGENTGKDKYARPTFYLSP